MLSMKTFRGVGRDFLLTHALQSKFLPPVLGEWEAVSHREGV